MKILDVHQGTPEWNAARAHHNTASEAPAMMGVSTKVKRNELLHMKATGSEREFSEWVQKNILDKGHEVEALARPIAEKIIGEELYPATVTDDDGYLLASLDGMTMAGDIVFEHKQYNAELFAAVQACECPPYHYWQVVQILRITNAEKCLFMVSDGTEKNCAHVWITLDQSDSAKLLAGWKQFDEDCANYVPPEVIPAAVAAPTKDLPAINYRLNGLSLTSNLNEYRTAALQLVEDSKAPLVTDQDFADRDALCKKFKTAEESIKMLQAQVVGEIKDVDAFCRGLDEISGLIRQARLNGEKMVEAEKINRKNAILLAVKAKWEEHLTGLNARLGKAYMPAVSVDFAGAMKGLKNIASMNNAVDTELARAKLEANAIADRIQINLNTLRELAVDHSFLFADAGQLVLKSNDDLVDIIKSRIADHKIAEEHRLEAERVRIRQEEEAKAKAATPAPEPVAPSIPNGDGIIRAPAAPSLGEVLNAVATANPGATIKLGEINERLGFTVSADFLASLGFSATTERSAKLYRECDFPNICSALQRHIGAIAAGTMKKAA